MFHAIDIESRLFPHKSKENVHFSVNSITKLPADWADKFRLVHQRMLIGGLPEASWKVALLEIHRALIPGGWAQLMEYPFKVDGGWDVGPCSRKMMTMMAALCDRMTFINNLDERLPSLVQDAGFVNIQRVEKAIPVGNWAGQDGVDMALNCVQACIGLRGPILKFGGFGVVASETEFNALLDGMEKEWAETPKALFRVAVVTCQKPN